MSIRSGDYVEEKTGSMNKYRVISVVTYLVTS